MPVPIIKICGMTDAILAQLAANAGADYIGMIFHPGSKRHIHLDQVKEMVEILKPTATQPVAVFVDQTAAEMQTICETFGINVVQLHGSMARQQHHLLPDSYQRIYVRNVSEDGQILAEADIGLQYCDSARDFLLFDNVRPGSGRPFAWSTFNYAGNFRWFLSGGLNVSNVAEAIMQLHPHGIDVSSGVEGAPGIKDAGLILGFIEKSKSPLPSRGEVMGKL